MKKEQRTTITFIRCGTTEGSQEGRYVGVLDEQLSEKGKETLEFRAQQGVYPEIRRVFSSTQTRCRETSYIIYPGKPVILVPELRAFNYGDYTGKTYSELLEDPRFQTNSKHTGPIVYPEGEDTYVFQARTTAAFQNILGELRPGEHVAIVSHEETILPILRRFSVPRSNYGDYKLNCGDGVSVSYDIKTGVGEILTFF